MSAICEISRQPGISVLLVLTAPSSFNPPLDDTPRAWATLQYWERKKQEYASNGRRLGERLTMGEWILAVRVRCFLSM